MKTLLILLILICLQQQLFGQDMDTSKVLTIRTGWLIGHNSKDSCLYDKLYKYKSGIFKEELQLCAEYSIITISQWESKRPFYGQDPKPIFEKFITKGSVDTRRYYYDNTGHLDSLILINNDSKSGQRSIVMKTIKRFDSENRLKTLESHEGILQYEYDTNGEFKTVLTRRNGTKQIDIYVNDKLTSESRFDASNEKFLEQKYLYDDLSNLIRADINKYEYWTYEYNKFGLTKEEKWGGPKNNKKLIERIVYTYDNEGNLRTEEWFEQEKLRKLIRYYFE